MARHLPRLQVLWIPMNVFGWESLTAIAKNLSALNTLWVHKNEKVGMGACTIGRIPHLRELSACTCEFM